MRATAFTYRFMQRIPPMSRPLIALALLAAIVFVACGGDSDQRSDSETTITPRPGNSELVVGANRFAFALADEAGPILDGDVLLRLFFGEELKTEQQAGFTWAIPDEFGFYVASVDFDASGQWTAEIVLTKDGEETLVTFLFPVLEESAFPNVGDAAPASDNLTLADEPNIKRLSTDQDPDTVFYETSIADAVTLGKPAVVIFATPAFCQTQFCGPVLDNVKAVQPEFADAVTFIHIEPFELDDEGLQRKGEDGGPIVVPAALEWNLQTEPWVYFLDADGIISARIEGAASSEELTAGIEAALG